MEKINFENCHIKWNNGYWKLFDSETYKDVLIFSTFEELAQYLLGQEN